MIYIDIDIQRRGDKYISYIYVYVCVLYNLYYKNICINIYVYNFFFIHSLSMDI